MKSFIKIFADNTSIFPVVNDKITSIILLNEDLHQISNWAFQWKMSFNPAPIKRAQEVIFSNKIYKTAQSKIFFNNLPVSTVSYLGLHLDEKLNFENHLNIIKKADKGVGVIKKVSSYLS